MLWNNFICILYMPNSITRHVVLATPTPGPGRQHHTSWRIQKNMTTNIIWMWPINIRMRIRMRTQNIRIRIRMRPPKHSHSHSNATTKHSHSHSNVSIQQGIRIRIRIRTKLRIRIRIRMRSYAFGYKPALDNTAKICIVDVGVYLSRWPPQSTRAPTTSHHSKKTHGLVTHG